MKHIICGKALMLKIFKNINPMPPIIAFFFSYCSLILRIDIIYFLNAFQITSATCIYGRTDWKISKITKINLFLIILNSNSKPNMNMKLICCDHYKTFFYIENINEMSLCENGGKGILNIKFTTTQASRWWSKAIIHIQKIKE